MYGKSEASFNLATQEHIFTTKLLRRLNHVCFKPPTQTLGVFSSYITCSVVNLNTFDFLKFHKPAFRCRPRIL